MSLAPILRLFRKTRPPAIPADWVDPRFNDRKEFIRHLAGDGIELGALQYPLDVSENRRITRLRYVDRYSKDELLRLFPECEPARAAIVETDVLCEVIHGLKPFKDNSLDFVIAGHLIEHMPDPIFFVNELWRVLRPGGILFLICPDKNCGGYDFKRPVTSLAHLIDDHRRGIREVEDHHLDEFLRLCENMEIPADPAARQALFDRFKDRSIHIHVWDSPAFAEFFAYCARTSAPFSLVEATGPRGTQRNEITVIARKVREPAPDFDMQLMARLDPPGHARSAS
jgi:SAM-dependent methyltransferase